MQVILLIWVIFHLLVHFLGPKWGDIYLTLREGNVRQTWAYQQAQKKLRGTRAEGAGGGSEGLFWTFWPISPRWLLS